MRADKTGDPADQLRYRIGWRTAEKGGPRCDGCEFAEVRPSGSGGADRVRCLLIGVATKSNGTCDKPPRLVQNKQCRDQSRWRLAAPGEAGCNTCEHFGHDTGMVETCFGMDFPTTGRHLCDHHQLAENRTLAHVLTQGGKPPAKVPPGWDRSCADCAYHAPHDEPDTVWCGLHNRTSPTGWEYRCGEHKPIKEEPTMSDETQSLPALASGAGQEIETYDKWRVVAECKGYMAQSAEAMLEAGKRLIQLKDNEPHGEFERIVEQELGLAARTAQVMMKASLKFLSPQLAPKAQALALLGKTKLFELVTEDDGDLAELAEGGTLAGKTLDEIDRMTSRELKAALRKSKEDARQRENDLLNDLVAKDKRIAKKDERINELEDKLENKAKAAPIDIEAATRSAYARDLADQADSLAAGIDTSLRARCKAVLESHGGAAHREHGRLLVAQALGRVGSLLRILAIDFDVNPAEEAREAFDHGMDGEDAEIWRMTHATLARQDAE